MADMNEPSPVLFERRAIHLFFLSVVLAGLSWLPVILYARAYPSPPGEFDPAGAGFTAITIFVSGVFLLCGVVGMIHATVSYAWRRSRQTSNRRTEGDM